MKTLGKWFSVLALSLPLSAVGCANSTLMDALTAQDTGALGPPAAPDPCVDAAIVAHRQCVGTADFRSSLVKKCNADFSATVAVCRRPDGGAQVVEKKPAPGTLPAERSASFIDPQFLGSKW